MSEQESAGNRKTPDRQYPGPSASLVETEETPENRNGP
jgi:hypothetical protein